MEESGSSDAKCSTENQNTERLKQAGNIVLFTNERYRLMSKKPGDSRIATGSVDPQASEIIIQFSFALHLTVIPFLSLSASSKHHCNHHHHHHCHHNHHHRYSAALPKKTALDQNDFILLADERVAFFAASQSFSFESLWTARCFTKLMLSAFDERQSSGWLCPE